jgi:SAM-dependent methyltransferase
MDKQSVQLYFDKIAPQIPNWRKKNRSYHKLLKKYFSFFVPPDARVLEIGCGTGDLLASVKPSYGAGTDFSPNIIEIAKAKYSHLHFFLMDAERLELDGTFDYIILSDLVSSLWDIQGALENIQINCHERTRIIISSYNYLWEPLLKLLEKLRLKLRQPQQNWLSVKDIVNLLSVSGFELIRAEKKILLPVYIPVFSWFFNNCVANLPFFRQLALVNFIIARPVREMLRECSVSVIIPGKNEKGNIENVISRIPAFGIRQEIIFVEGNSTDGTFEEMQRVQAAFPMKDIKVVRQSGTGKGNAVKEGFSTASGEILIILDADLTTPPEYLPRFYLALCNNKGEFINGCRLVYPREKQAMRFLNLAANKLFSVLFSYLLGQRVKDTLCGTKVLLKKDYDIIMENRNDFADFDPFGDFNLLFGAAKLNLKIVEINVRYKERNYGHVQISRFRHGWMLVKMTLYAALKLKFF